MNVCGGDEEGVGHTSFNKLNKEAETSTCALPHEAKHPIQDKLLSPLSYTATTTPTPLAQTHTNTHRPCHARRRPCRIHLRLPLLPLLLQLSRLCHPLCWLAAQLDALLRCPQGNDLNIAVFVRNCVTHTQPVIAADLLCLKRVTQE